MDHAHTASAFTWFGGWPAVARIGVAFALNMSGVAGVAFAVSTFVSTTALQGFDTAIGGVQSQLSAHEARMTDLGAAVGAMETRLTQRFDTVDARQEAMIRIFDRRADAVEAALSGQAEAIRFLRDHPGARSPDTVVIDPAFPASEWRLRPDGSVEPDLTPKGTRPPP